MCLVSNFILTSPEVTDMLRPNQVPQSFPERIALTNRMQEEQDRPRPPVSSFEKRSRSCSKQMSLSAPVALAKQIQVCSLGKVVVENSRDGKFNNNYTVKTLNIPPNKSYNTVTKIFHYFAVNPSLNLIRNKAKCAVILLGNII